jgi:hypothetical protein
MSKGFWTDKRIALLRALHGNKSAAQIAAEIGCGCTKSAVIGKSARLQLPPTGQPVSSMLRRERRITLKRPTAKQEKIEQPRFVFQGEPRALLELQPHDCRWPLWGEAPTEKLFCAAWTEGYAAGKPYCAKHTKKATRQLHSGVEQV